MTLFHQDDDQLPILLITGHGDVPMAVDAVKKGAWDFLQKPVDPGKLLILIEDALRQRRSVIARRQYCQQTLQVELIGRSEWMNQFRQRLQQLAETDIAVWFYGEHGTGRMTGARYLHQLGRNAKGPFVRYELTPENAGAVGDIHRPGARRYAGVESSRISDTRTAAPSGAFAKPGASAFSFGGRWQRFAGGAGGS